MTRIPAFLLATTLLASAAQAQQAPRLPLPGQPAPLVAAQTGVPAAAPVAAQPSPLDMGIAQIQQQWAVIKYQMPDEDQQEKAIDTLAGHAAALVVQFPENAEPLIWQGIVLATRAGIKGGLGALKDAKTAKRSLEQAEKINPGALNGSVYTSLGSLYYKVPGFPIGFGDEAKAKAYLEKALQMNPEGIDPNFFYGEFLYENGEYAAAEKVLQRALAAPPRPGRELADKGRAEEIRELMAKIQQKKS